MANTQLGTTQKMPYFVAALDNNGNAAPLAPGDTVDVTSSDTSSATIVPDSVPAVGFVASGMVFGQSNAQVGVVITATANKADGSVDIATAGIIDVVSEVPPPSTATSMNLTFGTPVEQSSASKVQRQRPY